MDENIKTYYKCYQILFNKPLLKTKDKYIYGFRMKYDELKHKPTEKQLMRYIVEAIFGKCLFQDIHDGSFGGKDDKIWIDLGQSIFYHPFLQMNHRVYPERGTYRISPLLYIA